jgi:hypothetical protein
MYGVYNFLVANFSLSFVKKEQFSIAGER